MSRDFTGSLEGRSFRQSANRDRVMSEAVEEIEGQMAAVVVRTTNITIVPPPAGLHALARSILDNAEFIDGILRSFTFDWATPGTINESQSTAGDLLAEFYIGRAAAFQTVSGFSVGAPIFSKFKLIRTGSAFVYCVTTRTYPSGFPNTPTCTTSRGSAESVEIDAPALPALGTKSENLIFLKPSDRGDGLADATMNPAFPGLTPPACCDLS